ncbi:TspO/MBR family protein [Aurantiacibacter poecillastricola]|uniref:TspO/MBR family protein n=1 Tax=Aurantiacibacter poecillastricola TaxID=3064385 RepID=UPI00273E0B95|nr:TspO/MBR family protein [Aurantiacibacter sp. 219JJ12-13]MDP5261575.1 TspO/MBR family protein [Aurantiacibacter sp. 219JJ12-13]
MNRLASPAQLRASLLRWALFVVPTVMLLGFLSGQVSGSSADSYWFQSLEKPALFPPPATFGIVWSILYFMMGVAFALVCAAWGSRMRSWAILAFLVQFTINLAWSPTFFGYHEIELALWVIVALNVALAVTMVLFFKVRKWAGALLVPYLAWTLFAAVLNWQFLELNPEASGAEGSGAVQRIEL